MDKVIVDLPVPLTEEEVQERLVSAAKRLRDIDELETKASALAAKKKELSDRSKELLTEARKLGVEAANAEATRQVECDRVIVADLKMVVTIRPDTDDLVSIATATQFDLKKVEQQRIANNPEEEAEIAADAKLVEKTVARVAKLNDKEVRALRNRAA